MSHISEHILINAPIEKVRDLAIDPSKWSIWYSGLGEAEEIEGDGGPGTTVKHSYLMAGVHFPVTTKVTDGHENSDGSYTHRNEFSGPLSGWQTWDYKPKDGGTEVVAEIEYTVPGKALGKLADRLVVERVQQRAAHETMERLKILAES